MDESQSQMDTSGGDIESVSANEVKMDIGKSDLADISDVDMDMSFSDSSDGLIPKKVFRKFKCEFCKKRYVDKRCFKSHIESHAGKKYTCEHCPNRLFRNIMSYHRHLNFHKRGNKYLVCDICNDKFEELYQLTSHQRKHDNATLPCLVDKQCEKKFKHKADQRRHSFSHRETKDFPCKVCGKMFQSPQSRAPQKLH